ncbi:MAG: gamma carbonic anhydrase family protein [Caldisericia bacterium]|nr:gamma carbonic anhydrase family protein [Caldisericia bacterium]
MIRDFKNFKPQIGKNSWISETATIIGNIKIGDNVGIWFGAILRGDVAPIEIGNNTNIQDNSVIHSEVGYPTKIGNGVTIGHNSIIHGCEIGDDTLIGMGAIILNGAKIGRNCIIGAGTVITEGKIIEDNSLVLGVPGKVVRKVTDEEIKRIKENARAYITLKEGYEK